MAETFREFTYEILGIAPLLNGQAFQSERPAGESAPAFEERCWMERLHVDADGNLYRPEREMHMTLYLGAKNDGEKIRGRGATQYASRVSSSTMASDLELWLPSGSGDTVKLVRRLTKDDVQKAPYFVPSDGKSGGGTRVTRFFPKIFPWAGRFRVTVFDHNLLEDPSRLTRFLQKAGIAAGLGMWRPDRRGTYGRFVVLPTK